VTYYNTSIEQLSKSKILCYLNCPFQFKLFYINKIPNPYGRAAEIGIDVHDILAKLYDQVLYEQLNPEGLEKNLKRIADDKFYHPDYAIHFQNFLKLEKQRFAKIPQLHRRPKYREVHLDIGTIHGIIDRIDYDPNLGRYILWDYKTGRVSNVKHHLFELTLYAYLFVQQFKKVIPRVGIIATKTGRTYWTDLRQEHFDGMMDIVNEVFGRIRREEFDKNPKANCFWCPQNAKKICRQIWGVEMIT